MNNHSKITESRVLRIQWRIVRMEDVRRLAETIREEFLAESAQFNVNVRCGKETAFTSHDLSLFQEDTILFAHRVTRIEIEGRDYTLSKRVECEIVHGVSDLSVLQVSGPDSNWVNGLLSRLQSVVEQMPKQNQWITKFWWAWLIPGSIAVGSVVFYATNWMTEVMVGHPVEISNFSASQKSVVLGVCFLLGCVGILNLALLLKPLWPSVEIEIGPPHLLVERRRRKPLITIFSVVVIPLFLRAAYDITKFFVR